MFAFALTRCCYSLNLWIDGWKVKEERMMLKHGYVSPQHFSSPSTFVARAGLTGVSRFRLFWNMLSPLLFFSHQIAIREHRVSFPGHERKRELKRFSCTLSWHVSLTYLMPLVCESRVSNLLTLESRVLIPDPAAVLSAINYSILISSSLFDLLLDLQKTSFQILTPDP